MPAFDSTCTKRLPYLRVVAICAVLIVSACTSMPSTNTADRSARGSAAEDSAAEDSQSNRASRSSTRRRRPAQFEMQGEFGFTITEEVRISGDVRAIYQNALRMLDDELYEQGIDMLLDVIATAPDVTAPHINLGMAYGQFGDFEQAEESFGAALELNPNHPIVHNELGILYRKTGRFADARTSYEKALAVHPAFHFARRNLAVLCDLYLADLSCALQHYESYAEAVPEDQEVAIWIADIRNRLSQ